jgi:hypothetical protein
MNVHQNVAVKKQFVINNIFTLYLQRFLKVRCNAMKRIYLSVFICLFLLTVSCANLDQESRLDNSMTVVKADVMKFKELDSTQDGIYSGTSSDKISVIGRILFQDNSLTDEIDFPKVSFTSTYYQYDGLSLRELGYNTENLGIYNPYITPLYINASNELFLWDESDHLNSIYGDSSMADY